MEVKPKQQFKALFLPPIPVPLFAPNDRRTDIQMLHTVVERLSNIKPKPSAAEIGQAQDDIAKAADNEASLPEARDKAVEWVNASLDIFKKVYLEKPNEDAIFFFIAPEFALAANQATEGAQIIHNSAAPPSVKFERFIIQTITTKLGTDDLLSKLKIAFVFSIATYENLVLPPSDLRKTDWFTIVTNSRISIVTKKDLKQVHKYEPASAIDGWPAITPKGQLLPGLFYTQKYLWNKGVQKHSELFQTPGREAEINITLPWKDPADVLIRVGFGTCFDVKNDTGHGTCNLCIYVGSGLPLDDVKDQAHPFLLCDTQYWTQHSQYLEPGYYLNSASYHQFVIQTNPAGKATLLTKDDVKSVLQSHQRLVKRGGPNDYELHPENYPNLFNLQLITKGHHEENSYVWLTEYFDIPPAKPDAAM